MVNPESLRLIRNYIIKREGKASMREVEKYMENEVPQNLRLSHGTVRKEIKNMENIIIAEREKRGQARRLLIEDKKEFNDIQEELSEIEMIIDGMDQKIKLAYERPKIKRWRNNKVKSNWLDINRDQLEKDFLIQFYMTIYGYLVRMSSNVKSEKNTQILHDKVLNLIVKMSNRSSKSLSWDLLKLTSVDGVKSFVMEDNIITLLTIEE